MALAATGTRGTRAEAKNPNGLYITISNPSDSQRRNHDRRPKPKEGEIKHTRQIGEEVEMIGRNVTSQTSFTFKLPDTVAM